jgi:hypothetical protein
MTLLPGCGSQKLHFTLVFQDAKGLRSGQLVVKDGHRIGTVTKVQTVSDKEARVEVEISSDPKNKIALFREDRYSIDAPGGALDFSGKRQVTITNSHSSQRIPVEPGDVISGEEGMLANLKRSAQAGFERLKKAGGEAVKSLKEFASSEDGKQFREDLTRYVEGASSKTRAELKELETKLRRSAEAWKETLVKKGQSDQAKAFHDRFQAWLKSQE